MIARHVKLQDQQGSLTCRIARLVKLKCHHDTLNCWIARHVNFQDRQTRSVAGSSGTWFLLYKSSTWWM